MFEGPDNIVNYYALLSVYGSPNVDLLEESSHALRACRYYGEENLHVIPVSSIVSVISMQPLPTCPGDIGLDNYWFVAEKSGIDDTELTGYVDLLDQE